MDGKTELSREARRLAGYQPQYFPRLHYLARALHSDVFEISDYVQFVRTHTYPMLNGTRRRGKSYQAHAPIKLSTGVFDLSVPVHDRILPINRTAIDYSHNWTAKHLLTIKTAYRRAPNFERFFPELRSLLSHTHASLAALTVTTVLWGLARLLTDERLDVDGLRPATVNEFLDVGHPFRLRKVLLASESPVPPPERGRADDWLIAFCRCEGATQYHCGGTGMKAYMDPASFAAAGIEIVVQDWQCFPYRQQHPSIGFCPNLSVIDLVMNEDLPGRRRVMSGVRSP
jgi:hypothetical protein